MACGLFGVKPLSEPMLPYCQLGLEERISVSVVKILKFSFKETSLKISSTKWRPLCLGLNVFIQLDQLIWPSITRGRRYCHYSGVALVSWRPNHCGATVCSIICSGKQLRNVSSTTLYEGIHCWPVGSPHKGSVMRKAFGFACHDVVGEDHFIEAPICILTYIPPRYVYKRSRSQKHLKNIDNTKVWCELNWSIFEEVFSTHEQAASEFWKAASVRSWQLAIVSSHIPWALGNTEMVTRWHKTMRSVVSNKRIW